MSYPAPQGDPFGIGFRIPRVLPELYQRDEPFIVDDRRFRAVRIGPTDAKDAARATVARATSADGATKSA
jgi:hypothetical protein